MACCILVSMVKRPARECWIDDCLRSDQQSRISSPTLCCHSCSEFRTNDSSWNLEETYAGNIVQFNITINFQILRPVPRHFLCVCDSFNNTKGFLFSDNVIILSLTQSSSHSPTQSATSSLSYTSSNSIIVCITFEFWFSFHVKFEFWFCINVTFTTWNSSSFMYDLEFLHLSLKICLFVFQRVCSITDSVFPRAII